MKHPLGTQYLSHGKNPVLCTVTDYHVTKNIEGAIVRERYVASHDFLDQTVTEIDIPEITIARGIARLLYGKDAS